MRILKTIILVIVLIFITLSVTMFVFRLPSYTIQTTGKLYIFNKLSQTITIFNLDKGAVENEILAGIEAHEAITLENQKKIVFTDYGTKKMAGRYVKVINTETNKIVKTINLKDNVRPNGIVRMQEPNLVGVVTDILHDFIILNTETGNVEKKIPIKQLGSHLIVLHPKLPIAYITNSFSNSVSVIDYENDKLLSIISCGKGTEGIDITKDGKEIWVSNSKSNTINIISTKTLQILNTIKTGKEPIRLKFSNDDTVCLVANVSDGSVSVYNRFTNKEIKTISIHGKVDIVERFLYHTPRPVNILMHPNGKYAFVSNSNANKIEVFDMKSYSFVSTIGAGDVPDGLAFIE